MSDVNVLKAQKYLNAMFGGHPSWVRLEEDGYTGTLVMQGIIRAFQIENNVGDVTGTVGPLTISKMKSLGVIEKMNPEDEGRVNVCLIQCALFCKGYNAGGITGIYYNAGVAAVSQLQSDAGLEVTGKIDWKVWQGLLSLNWFKLTVGGNETIRLIQQQLNGDWSNVIGVGPCDGVVSRYTAFALIGALQAAEGVTTELITNINSVNFGNATTASFENFPGTLNRNNNSSEYVPFNKLVQYGLYFNGYDPERFDGIYDSNVENQVTRFQEFYALTSGGLITLGEVNVSTMKSLLTSKGDTSRSARACDCATVLNQQQAFDLKAAGYTHVGRYLTGYVGNHIPKYLTPEEVTYIENAGLNVFPIYQAGGYNLEYFQNLSQGAIDAQNAIQAAENIGIPNNTIIYFAVDFDCYEHQIDQYIIPYFRRINLAFRSQTNRKNYRVGIYGPRYVCTKVSNMGLAVTSFVADMSTGFSCNMGFPIPKNWAFDQFFETSFTSIPSFPIDKDAFSGRDNGIIWFDPVPSKTEEEIREENLMVEVEKLRTKYVYDVLEPLGYVDKIMDTGLIYNTEIYLGTYLLPTGTITISAEISTEVREPATTEYSIPIDMDNSGNLTIGCQNQIASLVTELNVFESEDGLKFEKMLSEIALSVRFGNIILSAPLLTDNCYEISVCIGTDDLLPNESNIDSGISVEIIFKIEADKDNRFNVEEFVFTDALDMVVMGAAVVFYGITMISASGVSSVALASYLLAMGLITAISSDDTDEV